MKRAKGINWTHYKKFTSITCQSHPAWHGMAPQPFADQASDLLRRNLTIHTGPNLDLRIFYCSSRELKKGFSGTVTGQVF